MMVKKISWGDCCPQKYGLIFCLAFLRSTFVTHVLQPSVELHLQTSATFKTYCCQRQKHQEELCSLCLSCKYFYNLASQPSLWYFFTLPLVFSSPTPHLIPFSMMASRPSTIFSIFPQFLLSIPGFHKSKTTTIFNLENQKLVFFFLQNLKLLNSGFQPLCQLGM